MHKADLPKYTLYGYASEDTTKGCDDEHGVDTLKKAKRLAKHWMTKEYMNLVESTRPIILVQIFKGDELHDEVRAA
jgi:hypothetical protein